MEYLRIFHFPIRFYRDQIEITKDDKTRIIQIQGQRPLSTQTKARFNEAYRVPESCDMTKLITSFSHGLLTIEFPKVLEGEKPEKTVQNQEESGGAGPNESSLGRKKPLDVEKQVGTSQENVAPMANKEEPKTYKSVVEGKRPVPTGIPERFEQKMKEREASPSLGRKEATQIGQQKSVQKLKEQEGRSTPPTIGSSLKPKVHAKEDKVTETKKDGDLGQNKTGPVSRTPITNDGLEPKVHAKAEKVVERMGDGEIGQKLKEEGKIGLGQKKEEKNTKPAVGKEGRKTGKEIAATNQVRTELKTKEKVERLAHDFNRNGKSKEKDENMVGDKVSEEETQERVKQKKEEEAGLAKETGDVKDNAEFMKPEKVDSDDPVKEESTRFGEDREKIVKKSLGSETDPLLVEEGKKKNDMDPPEVGRRGMDQESQKFDLSLVNVGVAALVIMGFGAYAFVPLVKLFY
ncbi:unnamed protein product [Arabis nemorensis]|uniref:SHSP domain-containing protein n=1 Tax=Arabis nemorensis TaxID=586526 RepID=A0A565B7P1_9BRAS|nr:unnamed protein product [Arabis nemorensis]